MAQAKTNLYDQATAIVRNSGHPDPENASGMERFMSVLSHVARPVRKNPRKWPKMRRNVGDLKLNAKWKNEFKKLADQGVEKIWIVQVKDGHRIWETYHGDKIVYQWRNEAKAVAIRLSIPDKESRIVRWIDQKRRNLQWDCWLAREDRNKKMPAGGSKKGTNHIGEVRGLVERLLMTPGHTIRQVAKEAKVAKHTVNEIAKKLERPACPCGREVEHRGWCKFRFENSPKRQELLKDKGWSGQEVKVPDPAPEHREVTERTAKQELRQAQSDFRDAKKKLLVAQEKVSMIYRNQALGIIE